ncbi:unnamed protein product [Leptosia nina]|uniref:Uncharacterized protein n=1 Tax=Leptosia nina TaxID=320188 RepID=A0AAV1JIW2_9NEOP
MAGRSLFFILFLCSLSVGIFGKFGLRDHSPRYQDLNASDDDEANQSPLNPKGRPIQKAKICIMTPFKKYCVGEQHGL